MLEKYLQTLEIEKQKAVERVRKAAKDQRTLDLAIKEIEINYLTTRNFICLMHRRDLKLNEDLSSVKVDFDGDEEYREIYMHINHHFWVVRENIPFSVEEGRFEPLFSIA
ncbi:MAG: hypothetical protein NTW17_02290 [Candidatus Pacearchaeota archaeon]|nr:hypothetical protein [Candidatus Pacearchaeota archaeon]